MVAPRRCWRGIATWLALSSCGSPGVPDQSAFTNCGNSVCEPGETASVCPDDCGPCASKPNCDDGEACTVDSCDVYDGCRHLPLDATPCAGGPCVDWASCASGKCVGPDKLWQFSVSVEPGGYDGATGIAEDSNGDLIAVGNALRGVADDDNYLIRLEKTGPSATRPGMPQWLEEDANHDDLLLGVAALKDGGFLAVGERRSQVAPLSPGVQTWARWIWIKPQGDTPEVHHMTFAGNHGLAAVARASDGSLLAVGHVDATGLAARFNADATPGWRIALQPPTPGNGQLLAVVGLTGEVPQWLAVGSSQAASAAPQRGWAVHLAGPATDVAWNVELAPTGGQPGILQRVVALAEGGAIAVGQAQDAPFVGAPPPETARLWWVRLDGQGAVMWQALSQPGWSLQGLVRVPGQDLVLVSAGLHAGDLTHATRLVGRTLGGADRGMTPGQAASIGDLLALSDGTLAAAGVVGVGGQHDTWMARMDRWATTACGQSGSCAIDSGRSCDDANPCTADSCAGGLCQYSPVPDGAACGDGTLCKENQCVTGSP